MVEPNGAATQYGYDALNNLLKVTQSGISGDAPRNRTFSYDSLSRLLTAANPESGTTCYGLWTGGGAGSGTCQEGYDPNGNLLYRTDARGRITSYSYDALNRITAKLSTGAYAGSSGLGMCTIYDKSGTSAPTNAVGRVTAEWTQSGSCPTSANVAPSSGYFSLKSITQYDAMGRVLAEQSQTCTASRCSAVHPQVYSYDLASHLTSYMDGLGGTTFTQAYDPAGRFQALISSRNPAALLNLTAFSPVGWTEATMGSAATLTQTFDNRQRILTHQVTAGVN